MSDFFVLGKLIIILENALISSHSIDSFKNEI